MKSALGQKQDVSLFEVQPWVTDIHVFKQEGRTDGQGAFGGGDPLGGACEELEVGRTVVEVLPGIC
jgi:hypothetical protein